MDVIHHRRYYGDSYTWHFEAEVVEAASGDGESYAVLDSTYFYPTSGGQPHDTGTLGTANVIDVRIRESDGAVVHVLDAHVAPGLAKAAIHGARRFDHMQQHTGQHILSQAFLRVANATTIGFHLGAETVSIDLDAAKLSDGSIDDAVEVTNGLITSNVEVRAWFPTDAELAALALRKMPDVDGPLRVVAIGDFDYSACGGTHVARSAEVGLLSVLRTERMKRGTRIEFLAGHRARADYARNHATVRELSAALSCAPGELVDAVARLERPIDEVKGLAVRLTAALDVFALLGVTGARTQLVFARSENVAANLKAASDQALAALGGGKGGGGRVLMGAAAPTDAATLEAILQAAVIDG